MSDCKERILPACEKVIKEADVSGNCPSWSVCLPFGGNLRTEGGCIHYEAPKTIPEDGEYSRIVISNGCIVDAKKAEIPLYTSTPCAPVPAPCDCGGGGSASLPDPSPQAGNLFRYDVSGRPLAKLTVQNGDGISITGDGTASNPLTITNTQEQKDSGHIRAGSSVIKITGAGTAGDPVTIAHAEGEQGTFNGLTFDEYGHLTGYTATSAKGIQGIVALNGVEAQTDLQSGVATIQLSEPVNKLAGEYTLGGHKMTIDDKNRVYNMERVIDIQEQTIALGPYNVSINDTGSITEIENTFNIGNEYVKYFDNVGDTYREGTISLRTSAYLRIVYEAVMPTAQKEKLSIRVDGRPVAQTFESYCMSAESGKIVGKVETVTQGVMAAGTHTIQVVLAGGLTFEEGSAKLTVTTSWSFES